MRGKLKSILPIVVALLVVLVWQAARQPEVVAPITTIPTALPTQNAAPKVRVTDPPVTTEKASAIDEDGIYTSARDVADYLHAYGQLPRNFITKAEARKLGWSGGDLRPYAKDTCIGGDRFGNFEGILPEKRGRTYYECDIDTLNRSSRGAKRIVFSNDGLIYYTDDHYESFELLYGE